MRAADVSGLFQQSRDPGADYAQGTVLEFDQETGENAISVNGTILENLPILNTGEAITLKTNHIVGLLKWKSQWFILGRITIAGSGQFAAASTFFDSAIDYRSSLTFGPGYATKAGLAVPVPAWANEAVVIATATYNLQNTSGGQDVFSGVVYFAASNDPTPGNSGSVSVTLPAGFYGNAVNQGNGKIDVTGADTVDVWTEATTTDPWPAGASTCGLVATVIFRSTI